MTDQDIKNLLDYKRYFEKLLEDEQGLLLERWSNSRLNDYMDRIEEFKRELKNIIEDEQDDKILRGLTSIKEILESMIDKRQIRLEFDNTNNFKDIINHIEKITDSIRCCDLNSTEKLKSENRKGIIEIGKYIYNS